MSEEKKSVNEILKIDERKIDGTQKLFKKDYKGFASPGMYYKYKQTF